MDQSSDTLKDWATMDRYAGGFVDCRRKIGLQLRQETRIQTSRIQNPWLSNLNFNKHAYRNGLQKKKLSPEMVSFWK